MRLLGYLCFLIALATLATFEYILYLIAAIGTCASGVTPYVIARHCPSNTGTLIAIMMASFIISIAAGIATAALVSPRLATLLWTLLFVPIGIGFGIIAHASPNVAIVFYGLCVMFIIMGIAPLFASTKQKQQNT
jgi:hypothetical protein